jgi:hypothetical protein
MRCLVLVGLIGLLAGHTLAQNSVRDQIDKERGGSFLDAKTYEKARSFIRRDSNYYVGHLMEGGYLFFRANDKLGFRIAAVPLQKALDKIEHDYDRQLRTRTNSFAVYNANYRYHFDYGLITYFLNRCYENLEDQTKAMAVLYHLRDRNFQMEVNMSSYNTMAWIFHRNRMYTSKQFPFLKNSVNENVAAANRYLDSALRKIQLDMPVNNGLYDPNFLNRQFLNTFHYKAMIYDYKLDLDSANYYYNILIQNRAYSPNNYAEYKLAMADMESAEHFFREAEQAEQSVEKRTKEYYYMRGSLAIYRGHPEKADSLLADVLQKQGSTPGFGWHCIGLARAQHFEGLTAESQDRVNKAARFQELHIGTTWGQEQYNLAVASLNYLNELQFKREYWFEHDEWYFWLNPLNWYRFIRYTLEIHHHKMVLASLVAQNPEREQVIYTIFANENLITFDEVWSVIEGFGNEFFIDLYKKRLETDKRPLVKKYFRYFLGKLYLAEGKDEIARQYFLSVLNDPEKEDPYQTLLMARAYEGMALTTKGDRQKEDVRELYRLYPGLVPFGKLTMAFRITGEEGLPSAEKNIVRDLRRTRIHFTDDANDPLVKLSFATAGKVTTITYEVAEADHVWQRGSLRIDDNNRDSAGKLLAYSLFGIHKTTIGDQPPPVPPASDHNVKRPV